MRKVADAGTATALRRLDPNQLTRVGALQREDAVTVVAYWTVVKDGLISHLAHSSPSSPHLQWLRDECTPSYLVRRLATCSPTLHTVDASDKKRFRTAVINATTRARKRTPNNGAAGLDHAIMVASHLGASLRTPWQDACPRMQMPCPFLDRCISVPRPMQQTSPS